MRVSSVVVVGLLVSAGAGIVAGMNNNSVPIDTIRHYVLTPAPTATPTPIPAPPLSASPTSPPPIPESPPDSFPATAPEVPPPPKVVYLTFDDGPSAYTPKILDILATRNIHATFFMIGTAAQQSPDVVARITQEGHAIGLHSWKHTSYKKMTPPQIQHDIAASNDAIAQVGGVPGMCIRPPYGDVTPTLSDTAQNAGYKITLWNVDTLDWTRPSPDTLTARITSVTPGSVILLHDGGGDRSRTVEALPNAISTLTAAGYTFDRIPECWVP